MQYVGNEVGNAIRADMFTSEFSAVRHESMKNSCRFDAVPASTYMEIAKDAFIKYYQDGVMELRDVVLLAPYVTDCESPREIRTLIKKEIDYLKFIISSISLETDGQESSEWIRHAEGYMYKVNIPKKSVNKPLELKDTYPVSKRPLVINAFTKQSGRDKAWNINLFTYKGDGEELLEFEIPQEVAENLQGYMVTPNMIDCMVGEAIGCMGEKNWSGRAYDSLVWYGALPHKVFVHVRRVHSAAIPDGSCFDITLLDEEGNVFADIKNYKIRYGVENRQELLNDKSASRDKSNPFGGIYDGYSTAKHSRTVDDISNENNAVKYISNLSWRQMNCRDRSIAMLLGHKNDMLVNYFKFLIGAKRGYYLAGVGLGESVDWREEIFHTKILEKLGYKLKISFIDRQKGIHSEVAEVIDNGRPVCVWLDEYYLFYTPFYLNSHTGHIAVINGYNREKKLYSIFDHNHLRSLNMSKEVNYGQFYCTFDTVENIYLQQDEDKNFIVTLDRVPDEGTIETGKLHDQFKKTVKYLLLSNKAAGKDVYTVYDSVKEKGNNLDIGCIDRLYAQLGGKELLIDTLLKYFCHDNEDKKHVEDLGIKIIDNSNKLINNYVTSLYREKAMPISRVEECIEVVENSTLEFLKQFE